MADIIADIKAQVEALKATREELRKSILEIDGKLLLSDQSIIAVTTKDEAQGVRTLQLQRGDGRILEYALHPKAELPGATKAQQSGDAYRNITEIITGLCAEYCRRQIGADFETVNVEFRRYADTDYFRLAFNTTYRFEVNAINSYAGILLEALDKAKIFCIQIERMRNTV